MKHVKLGDLEVSRIGLGAMGMSAAYTGAGSDDAESIRTIHRALDLGVTFIDTAEIYGPFINEELVGRALKGRRDQVVIGTKFGFMSNTGTGWAGQQPGQHPRRSRRIVASDSTRTTSTCTTSTASIRTHRSKRRSARWPNSSPHGKVRHLGLSEAGPTTIRRAHAVHPITALQSEYSLWTRDPEDGVLAVLRELGIGFVPYSPLGHGFLTGAIRTMDDFADDDWRKTNPRFTGENFEVNLRIVAEVEAVATNSALHRRKSRSRGCSRKATTSPRSPAPSASPGSRRTSPPTTSP